MKEAWEGQKPTKHICDLAQGLNGAFDVIWDGSVTNLLGIESLCGMDETYTRKWEFALSLSLKVGIGFTRDKTK